MVHPRAGQPATPEDLIDVDQVIAAYYDLVPDPANPDHVAAPFAGVVTVGVAAGDAVEAGQTIATIEAMKMEAAITAPKAGTVVRVAVSATAQVEGGDLLVVVGGAT